MPASDRAARAQLGGGVGARGVHRGVGPTLCVGLNKIKIEVRFNGCDNPFLFHDTLHRMIEGDALPYAELVET